MSSSSSNSNINTNSNAPLNSFASAATGLKSASSLSNGKLSSAELLSMLKKPQTTASPSTTSVIGPNSNLNPFTSTPSTIVEPVKSIAHPFKDDDYTLQGLINLIKACQSTDRNIFALGVDLENDIGLSMNQNEPLRESLLSPWYDEVGIGSEDRPKNIIGGASGNVGLLGLEGNFINKSSIDHRRPSALDSIIPSCYHIPSLPAALLKIASFSDETLFYIFYAMPGDRMQELAARELYSRNWRFYKPAKAWVCPVDLPQSSKDINSILNNLTNNNNNGPINFFLFDQSAWIKVKRSIQLQPDDLELSRPVNSGTASPVSSPEIIMHGSGTLQSTSVTH